MKNIKRFLALLLALTCCFATTSVAFAASASPASQEQEVSEGLESTAGDAVEPRLGYAGHVNHYHSGSSYYGEFTIPTKSILFPGGDFSIQVSGFNSDTTIMLEFYNSKGQSVINPVQMYLKNGTRLNDIHMHGSTFSQGDTYKIVYNVLRNGITVPGDDGYIEVWIH